MITIEDTSDGTFSHMNAPRTARKIVLAHNGQPVVVVKATVGSMDNNCYLIATGTDALLIDAAHDAEYLLSLATELNVHITDVLTTHRHDDHVQALPHVLAATGARHHAPSPDAAALPAAVDQTWGDSRSPEGDRGETVDFASPALTALGMLVILLRGHTAGGLGLIFHPDNGPLHLFTGDSLFPGGVGKTPTSQDFAQLLDDVTARCFRYPDPTVVHPGHGDDTTLGAQRPFLDDWRQRGW